MLALFVYYKYYISYLFQAAKVMEKFDKDGDGKLDFEEFQKMLRK